MYRKDFIESEIQKLAQALARILKLKQEGSIETAHEQIEAILQDEFGLSKEYLDNTSVNDLELWLLEKQLPEKKLEILAQLLFESAHPFEEMPGIMNRLHLVLLIFNHIEKEYRTQSLDNIARREMIDKFLNTRQYE